MSSSGKSPISCSLLCHAIVCRHHLPFTTLSHRSLHVLVREDCSFCIFQLNRSRTPRDLCWGHRREWQQQFWELPADVWRSESGSHELLQVRWRLLFYASRRCTVRNVAAAPLLAARAPGRHSWRASIVVHAPCRLMKNGEAVLLYPGGVREVSCFETRCAIR